MPQLKIDPIQTYYSVAKSLIGRILLFFIAGWCGGFLGRLAAAVREFKDLLRPHEVIERVFGAETGLGMFVELIMMVAWPASTAVSAAQAGIPLFFITMPVIIITFVIFIYSEEPPPAWCIGLIGFSSIIHVAGMEEATFISWGVLLFFLVGLGSAFWWALRVFHPELVQSVGDLLRGRSSRPVSVMSERHKAPPGTWPDPAEGWANRPIRPPKDGGT